LSRSKSRELLPHRAGIASPAFLVKRFFFEGPAMYVAFLEVVSSGSGGGPSPPPKAGAFSEVDFVLWASLSLFCASEKRVL